MISQYQKFTNEIINRKQINFAYYNPRKINDTNRKKLKKLLKDEGLLESLTWNKQTGNLISGHQRLAIIDQLENNDDYDLSMNVIDVPLEKEVKYNIVLNNDAFRGEFDKTSLEEIHREFLEIDFITELGFDKLDLNYMDIQLENENKEKKQEYISSELQKIKENNIAYKKELSQGDSIYGEQNDYILTIVFNNNQDKWNFCNKMNIQKTEKYIKYSKIYDISKEEYKI
jgi:hypothetical protein